MLTCGDLKDAVKSFSLVRQCDVVKSGALRIATPFHYPDGSLIDLFLKPIDGNPGYYVLSDGGQTTDYVADLQFNLWGSKKRRLLIDDICQMLAVKADDGSFEVVLSPDELQDLPQAIVRVAQASLRATDLIYMQRSQNVGAFQDEIEDFFSLKDMHYESDVVLQGDAGKPVKVDFQVKGARVSSLVQTLSGRTSMHAQANERVIRWIDLESYKQSNQFITLVDQSSAGIQQPDLRRLEKFSQVFSYPDDQDQFYDAVAA